MLLAGILLLPRWVLRQIKIQILPDTSLNRLQPTAGVLIGLCNYYFYHLRFRFCEGIELKFQQFVNCGVVDLIYKL